MGTVYQPTSAATARRCAALVRAGKARRVRDVDLGCDPCAGCDSCVASVRRHGYAVYLIDGVAAPEVSRG